LGDAELERLKKRSAQIPTETSSVSLIYKRSVCENLEKEDGEIL